MSDLINHGRRRLLGATAMTVAAAAIGPIGSAAGAEPKDAIAAAVEHELIGSYDRTRLAHIIGDELSDFMSRSTMPTEFAGRLAPPRYEVKLYRVKYPSVVPELGNRPTVASGLVAVPASGASAMPLVSYQHGTVFDRSFVPSNPDQSMETRVMLAAFAAQGYAVIGADYFGRGQSDLPDSYLVKESTQQATFDMLRAGKAVLGSLGIMPTQLFVSGWSQGGWATMAFLQKLERSGVAVTAAAAASAPVDVALAVSRWLNNPQAVDAVYLPAVLAIQIGAYSSYHDAPGMDETAFAPAYLAPARDLYRGRVDFETFFARTKPTLREFTRPQFRAAIATGEGRYWRTLDSSEVYRWRCRTPLRTWYGGSDEVTPIVIGKLPKETQKLLGGAATEAIDAGEKADHRAVFIRAVLDQKPWFDSLLAR